MARRLLDMDTTLTKRLYKKPKWLQPIMFGVSAIGRPIVIMPLCGLLALAAYFSGRVSIGFGFGLCLIALAFGGLLKGVLKRERPASLYVSSMRIKSFSFPSGHALGTLVLYGYLIALAVLFLPQLALPSMLIFGIVIILTGLSRIYLGAHYVSDVLGGWLLGALALFLIIKAIL